MRVSPLGNFMSWPSEVFRTGTGIFRQIIKDLKDPVTGKINPITSTNPMKAEGMKRLVGMTAAAGIIPYGLIKGFQKYLVLQTKKQMQVEISLHHGQKIHNYYL